MKYLYFIILFSLCFCGTIQKAFTQVVPQEYLKEIKTELTKEWPKNRTINLIFHGHSVPSGYFKTPIVNTFDSYPYQLLRELKSKYPYAVINVIVTSIGGENSVSGEMRFKKDVLIHKPDVIFIDYALNDRNIGLDKARVAWDKMIKMTLRKNIKVILLTPSPDQKVNILEKDNILEKHAEQIRELSKTFGVGLVDSYKLFQQIAISGDSISKYMAQVNHPNEKGHFLIAQEIMKYFNL